MYLPRPASNRFECTFRTLSSDVCVYAGTDGVTSPCNGRMEQIPGKSGQSSLISCSQFLPNSGIEPVGVINSGKFVEVFLYCTLTWTSPTGCTVSFVRRQYNFCRLQYQMLQVPIVERSRSER